MPKYETRVTLPEDITAFLGPFLQEGETEFDIDMINSNQPGFIFRFEATDMWEAHELVSDTAREADAQLGRMGGATEYTKAEEVVGAPSQTVPQAMARVRQRLIDKGLRHPSMLVGYQTLLDILDEVEGVKPESHVGEDGKGSEPLRLPDIDVDSLTSAPRTETVYMTAEAAAAASSGERPSNPLVGDGATLAVGSDRYPYTITEVVPFKSGSRKGKARYVRATLDDYRRDTSSGTEHYLPRPDREPEEFIATEQPHVFKSAKGLLRVGKRAHYLAPEF